MVIIQNPEATKAIMDAARITYSEGIPQNLLPNVVPVMDMTPSFHQYTDVVASGAAFNATATIYTTPAASFKKVFYLTGFVISHTKDVTSLSIYTQLAVTLNSVSTSVGILSSLSATPESSRTSVTLKYPLKVDVGTAITLLPSDATGNIRMCATIYGFLKDNF
jgi:hypothetical protein